MPSPPDIAPDPETPAPPPSPTPPLAFFDLDGTLVKGNTQQYLIKFLWRRGMAPLPFLIGTLVWFAAYKLGLVHPTDKARSRAAALFADLSVEELARLMDDFCEVELAPRLNPSTLAALAHHKAAGDRVIILSAAVEPLVRALADRLGVEEISASPLGVEDGRMTGELGGQLLYAERKVDVAREALAATGADPSACYAYADHETDLLLLQLVGHPVAVRPKSGLLKVARAAGWPVLE